MGLIKAAMGAADGVMADQWKEFLYCDSLDKDTLAAKGQKRTSSRGRSSNTSGEDNIITKGSVIVVNEGQCMMIVEQGKVVEICAEPGEYIYDSSTEPTVFGGDLASDLKAVFRNMGKRFTFGGDGPARLLLQHERDHGQQVRYAAVHSVRDDDRTVHAERQHPLFR